MAAMDPMALVGAFTGIKTILDISKTLEDQKVVSAINSAVADVNVKLILTQQQIMQVQEENAHLKEEFRLLRDAKALEDSVVFHDGAYWRKKGNGTEDGPFCPSCWGLDKKLVLPSINCWGEGGEGTSLVCFHHGAARYFDVPTRLAQHLRGK